jgi:hypothetical protein
MITANVIVSGKSNQVKALELNGERFRAPKGSTMVPAEVAVLGFTRRGGRVFVTDGSVTETWHRANATQDFEVEVVTA